MHQFKVRQKVTLVGSRGHPTPRDLFEIVRVLPAEHGNNQYRIKSTVDGHERVVTEGEIDRAARLRELGR